MPVERRRHEHDVGRHDLREHCIGVVARLMTDEVLHILLAAQAADAGTDIIGVAGSGLVAELGITQIGAAHHADVGGTVLDQLLGNPGLVNASDGGNGNVDVLFDLARAGGMRGLLSTGGGNCGTALDGGTARHVNHVDVGLLQAT